ncbi:MAG: hypothetical protein ACRES7_10600 [Gammaproteobacteria bacterium]
MSFGNQKSAAAHPLSTVKSHRTAVAVAYLNTFRILVIICGILAALSGLIAWLTLGKRNTTTPK